MRNRERGYLISALRGLGIIEVKRSEHYAKIYLCRCGKEFLGSKVGLHFVNSKEHAEVYQIILKLMRVWNLIGGEEMEIDIISEKEFSCWCGKSYNRKENLYRHRREKSHTEKLSVEISSSVK